MSLIGDRTRECLPITPIANSQKRVHGLATNLHSQKKRRLSFASVDLERAFDCDETGTSRIQSISTVDRFVSVRPKTFLPLNITPRTRRISKLFGLVDDKVLNFNDGMQIASSSSSRDENTMHLLRRSVSSLFHKPPIVCAMSVTENLSKQKDCRAILDSPGVPRDPDAYPISWSRRNLIAVVCLFDIFYQDLNTKSVSQLCRSTHSTTSVIQWAGDGVENYLASGNNSGSVLIWDAGTPGRGQVLCKWRGTPFDSIKSLAWNQTVLATGAASGELSLIDTRVANTISKVGLHTSPLVGLQWSSDGTFLASGDKSGIVQIWDRRVGKSLLDGADTKKIRHKGSAKALSWCPWKHDLLATGTTAPEGKIRIWNTSSMTSPVPTPERTIPLNTSVTSLHWSPHCKEILSTHGSSFTPVLQSRSQNSANAGKLSHTKTPLVNSIAVHQYPSCKRLMTLTDAHSSVVTHSCLSPEGESIFTVCPREETIKMWKVWSAPKPIGKRECAFDKYAIR